ncbi:hypothetical protein WH52_10535 [Tenacibaculum holothuriorum]|uniref:DUF3857 domain-containing protein n=1 Tax=Tenacibaculum holothuriorum TaxID=1635173 RepID=A0A1Y2PCL1_9FLAO|nr:DUF3857 domain-containing protein [Tenacibaculum holothuriorum]OSY87537.1 hypothetical protein WH52_10535 [Tenacibaculum holothuriorum]
MQMKITKFLLLLFFTTYSFSQNSFDFSLGKTKIEDLKLTHYSKDSTTKALILDEFGYVKANTNGSFTKEYYTKIKIFDKSIIDDVELEIPYFGSNKKLEIKAVVYNLSDKKKIIKTVLKDDDVYEIKQNKYFKLKSFALPNIRNGSVIEYYFKTTSYSYGVYNWYFQSSIPKLKSSFFARLPNHIKLNIRLIGYLSPSFNETKVLKNCIGKLKCITIEYKMEDIPPFVTEKYTSNKYNYLSHLTFEKEYDYIYLKGTKNRDWRTLDKRFKKNIGFHLNKSNFYKRKLPENILKESNSLIRAQKVFYFIQKHFSLSNQTFDYNTAKAYKERNGTQSLINLSLYYALRAANINAKLVLASTRDNGKITKLHATLNGFNYFLVNVQIKNNRHTLDASNKNVSFGMVPFKCLNGEIREFDFILGSSWKKIPQIPSSKNIKIFAKFDNEILKGKVSIKNSGYYAFSKREKIKNITLKNYIEGIEDKHPFLDIYNFKIKNENNATELLYEKFDFDLEIEDENSIKIYPHIFEKLEANPFKLKQRQYPVDFGFNQNIRFMFSIEIPKKYKIKSIPSKRVFSLKNKTALYLYTAQKNNNIVTFIYQYKVNKAVFSPSEYLNLKEFYNQIIHSQNVYIELEK